MPNRPNVLFLMSDEHRADITGYEGNTIIRTPVLDELARTGVVFSNAYAPSPICIPGRQCMMAGQFAPHCGCQAFSQDLAPGYMTFARRFAQYAYNTVCAGKLHHSGPDQMQGWTQRIAGDMHVAPQFIEGAQRDEFERYHRPLSAVKWSDAKEIKRAGIGRPRTTQTDEFTIEGAKQFIENYFLDPFYDREQPAHPLLLKVSLIKPHYPYFTTEEHFNYYLNRVQPFRDQQPFAHPFLGQRQVKPGVDASEREIRRAVAAYYGMIETIDEQFGEVLKALEYVGQNLDDWIILYTTDHGEMLGEHGIWEKQKFFEASARVPLIIRWPRGFAGGKRVTENVSHCDLFATLCELAGIPVPPGLDSRSLAPLLRGEPVAWDNEAVSHFGPHNVMIKRDALKYQYYGPEMPEALFDLARNPAETVNYIADPAYGEALAAFRARLEQASLPAPSALYNTMDRQDACPTSRAGIPACPLSLQQHTGQASLPAKARRRMDTLKYRELYHRHLPHFQPGGATLFVTYRLAGSVPAEVIRTFEQEAEQLERRLAQIPDPAERARLSDEERRRQFGRWDKILDGALEGPFWLREPPIAALVAESLRKLNAQYYDLLAFCIMPNHVHAVFTPLPWGEDSYHALSKITHSLKSYTAQMANRQLGRKGAFWQDESYDHVARNAGELQRIIAYVLNNPVRAGLTQEWQKWPWTYCKEP